MAVLFLGHAVDSAAGGLGGPVGKVADVGASSQLTDDVGGLEVGGVAELGDQGLEGVGLGRDLAQAALEPILAANSAVELVVTLLVQTQAPVARRTGAVALGLATLARIAGNYCHLLLALWRAVGLAAGVGAVAHGGSERALGAVVELELREGARWSGRLRTRSW